MHYLPNRMPHSRLSINRTETILLGIAKKQLENKLHTNFEQAAGKKNKDMVNQANVPSPTSFKLTNGFRVSQFWIKSQPEN